MEQRQFRAKGCYDRKTLRESNFGSIYMAPAQLIGQLLTAWVMASYAVFLWTGGEGAMLWWAPAFVVFWTVLRLIELNGGVQYKRMLVDNNGVPVRFELTFGEEDVQILKTDNQNVKHYDYGLIRRIGETRNLLILMMEQNLVLIVDKRNLEGGTKEELLAFLFAHCKKLKKRKVLGSKRLIPRAIVFGVLLIAVLSGGVYQWLFGDSDYEDYMPSYHWASYLTGEELTARLEKLGFDEVDEEILLYLEDRWSDYEYDELPYIDKVSDLLWEIGCGSYEEDSWEFVPSSDDVYAYWEEFENGETMYDEFLRGIGALGDGELDFTIVKDNTDNMDLDELTGTRELTLSWNGEEYTFTAAVDGTWIDPCFVNELNDLIRKNSDKQLYFGYDDYWNVYAFYCDDRWATEFYETTGMWLYDEAFEYEDVSEDWGEGTLLTALSGGGTYALY